MSVISYPSADIALARRLENAEGRTNLDLVQTRRRIEPASFADSLELAGVYVMFDGADSPLTQTFAFGVSSEPSAEDLESIETFFNERGADTHHEVSPLVSAACLDLLNERFYQPLEFTSVLYRPIDADLAGLATSPNADVTVRVVTPEEAELWGHTAAAGWSEFEGLEDFLLRIGRLTIESRSMKAFIAEEKGRPIATGALSIQDGVALLAGASTVPDARRRGAQSRLLEARLRFASEAGCDLAMMCASPGSASQRNAERQQFRIAYTRVKWRKGRHRAADLSKVN